MTAETAPADRAQAADQERILAELTQILADVAGEDLLLDVEITMSASFSDDLALESIEFVALAERVQQRYDGRVDLTAFLADMDIDAIIDLTVGDVIAYIRRCTGPGS
jgi:acyl carrier protein